LKQHETAWDADNGMGGARVTELGGETELTEEQRIAALDLLMPVYDFVLFLDRAHPVSASPLVLRRARSVQVVITEVEGASPPLWIAAFTEDDGLRDRLDIAMLTGEGVGRLALEDGDGPGRYAAAAAKERPGRSPVGVGRGRGWQVNGWRGRLARSK
jgi:hypothetical protein